MNVKKLVTWVLCIVVAGFFVMSAIPKLTQKAEIVGAFEAWGYSTTLLLLIGVLELLGAILLLIPRTATWGAAIIVVVMGGAAYTHLSTGIGSPMTAIIALLLAAVAGWLRKGEAVGLLSDS